jgi:hypothetical protein
MKWNETKRNETKRKNERNKINEWKNQARQKQIRNIDRKTDRKK